MRIIFAKIFENFEFLEVTISKTTPNKYININLNIYSNTHRQ
jgi:hypothetical protein